MSDDARRTRWNSTIRVTEPKPIQRGPVKKRNAKRKGHRFPKLVDESYRRWIRRRPCLLKGKWPCLGDTEADHVKTRGAGGSDRENLVPLCTGHHGLKHSWGRKSFEAHFGLDLAATAKNLDAAYTDRVEEPS